MTQSLLVSKVFRCLATSDATSFLAFYHDDKRIPVILHVLDVVLAECRRGGNTTFQTIGVCRIPTGAGDKL